ncbi:hypothetical protein F2S74_05305 [Pseudomonas syringae pv. actinidiae]|nr:hypothetical protein [Pseudomonas syringae pv. actinidiae]
MLKTARSRDKVFEARKILVVDDDVRNIFALTARWSTRAPWWKSPVTASKRLPSSMKSRTSIWC